jgi:uncharacterized SAM-binding protein YcdF (DUF218 family)
MTKIFNTISRFFKLHKLLRLIFGLVILTIGGSELADWMASNIAANPSVRRNCAVLVLGYPSHEDGSPDPVQVQRVSAGVQADRLHHCEKMILSGGAVKNSIVEAQTMAQLASKLGMSSSELMLEPQARNTWENIKFSIIKLEKYDQVLIVSDSLHAQRGRRYLCKQRSDLCDRTFVAVKYQPFHQWWRKIPFALHALFAWLRDSILF